MECAYCHHDLGEDVKWRRAMPNGPLFEDTPLCSDCYRDVLGMLPERPKP